MFTYAKTGTIAATDGASYELPLSAENARHIRTMTVEIAGTFGGDTITAYGYASEGGTPYELSDSSGVITWTVGDLKNVLTEGFGPFVKYTFVRTGAAGGVLDVTVNITSQ